MSIASPTENMTARQIVETGSIVTFFQPILSARQRAIVGAEALSRGVVGMEALTRGTASHDGKGQLMPPSKLFRMAANEGVTVELERLCRKTAIDSFARVSGHEDLILFLNFGPSALEQDHTTLDDLVDQIRAAGLSPRNVGVEILESAFEDTNKLRAKLDDFRACGFLLVLDDIGTGHSNLDRIPLIKPDILKLDRSLVVGIESDYHQQETFKSLVQLTRRIGSIVVAEGIETQGQAMVALELGADLLQGFFLGHPQCPEDLGNAQIADRIDALARRYKAYMISRINQRKLQHRRFNIIINQILCELTRVTATEFDDVLQTTLPQYENVECVYIMDETGTQVSSTVLNHRIPRRDKGVMFRPAPRGADHSLKEYYYVLLDVDMQKYTTDPYVSLATGNLCRTISTCFRDSQNSKMYILCIDVLCE